jgi:hypothetical protein
MTLCTNCAEEVPYLYTVYHSVNNVRLEQCVRVASPTLFDPVRPTTISHIHPRSSLHAMRPQIPMSSMTRSSSR